MKFKSRLSGEVKQFGVGFLSAEERTLWKFRKRLRDFERVVVALGLSLSILTVTQSDASVDSGFRWVTDVMRKMRQSFKRCGFPLFYIAVLEVQPKRFYSSGVLAAHWHIVIAYSVVGSLPHTKMAESGRFEKVRDGSVITWGWFDKNVKQKIGVYFCCDVWGRVGVESYLEKYLLKPCLLKEYREKVGRRVRVFASSVIPVEFQMSWFQKIEYASLVEGQPELGNLRWRREGSSIVGRAVEVVTSIDCYEEPREKIRYPVVCKIAGEWLLPPESDWAAPSSEGNSTA